MRRSKIWPQLDYDLEVEEEYVAPHFTCASFLKAILAVLCWMVLNMSLSLLNKYFFQEKEFKFPILIIIGGISTTFLGSFLCIFLFKMTPFPYETVAKHWKLLFLLSISHGLSSAFENISIVYISVSLNQIIKATSPAGTIIGSILFEGKTFSKYLILSTGIIVIGAGLAVFRNPEFHWVGFICAVLSTLFGVVQNISIGLLMQKANMNALVIAFTTSLPAIITLVPGFLLTEYEAVTTRFHGSSSLLLSALSLLSFLAFFYNMSHFFLINYTSAHYAVLVGNMKVLILVFVSMSIFHTPLKPLNVVGMLFSLGGFCVYNAFRFWELKGTLEKENNLNFTTDVVNRLISTERNAHTSDDEEELQPF